MRITHITDLHLGDNRPAELRAVKHLAQTLQCYSPDVILITGDLISKADEETFIWAKQCIKLLGPNVKVVPGNWDCEIGVSDGRALFEKYFGPAYYSFDIQGVHFIGLDTAGDGLEKEVCYGLGNKQSRWLANDLAQASKSNDSVVIFTHMPWMQMVSEAQGQLKRIISNYPVHIYLCGHTHVNRSSVTQSVNSYITSPALDLPNRLIDPPSMRLLSKVNGKWKEELLPIIPPADKLQQAVHHSSDVTVNDFHVHTKYSGRAQEQMTPATICKRGLELNFRNIGFTDHLYKHTTYEDVIKLREAVDNVNNIEGIKTFFGIEIELANFSETTLPAEWRCQFDYVLLSLDHASGPAMPVPLASDIEKWIQRYRIGFYVAGKSGVDILAHPFSGCPKALDAINNSQLIEMLQYLADGEVSIEMNALKLARDGDKADYDRLYRLACDIGLSFATGSDAHTLKEFGRTEELNPWLNRLNIDESMLWCPSKVSQKVMNV
jgi:histidinol phosphatase-like PHP family hydrolase/predicted phosphodiesterase